MTRMNVMKKLTWLKVYETYWDVLPVEIQEYIFEFKISQEYLDEVRAELMFNLRLEITLYHQLKLKWGLGPIKCQSYPFVCKVCKKRHCTRILAYYFDEANVRQEVFLEYDLQRALARVSTVKQWI